MGGRDVIAIVEAAYRLDQSEDAWLGGVSAAVRPFVDEGSGICAFFYEVPVPRKWIDIQRLATFDMDPQLATAIFPSTDEQGDEATRAQPALSSFFRKGGVESILTASRHAPLLHRRMRTTLNAFGQEDLLCLNSVDRSGEGCSIGAPLRRRKRIPPATRGLWSRVSAHIAAGYRIQRTLRSLDPAEVAAAGSEAILDPGGRVHHAEGPACQPTARDALREAALRIESARGSLRTEDPGRALEAWQGLIAGRWSLVDRFDRDGRRYLIAHCNEPEAADTRGLTLRERQVLEQAALGRAQKVIAYELGITPAAVSRHLTNARRKLGAANLADLFAMFSCGASRPAR
jgi:DNA-binding CsgD family transcriptional regulator